VPGYLNYCSEGWRLEQNLLVKKSELFLRKTAGDSFFRTELQNKLKSLEISDLVICGYASEFCIDNTTVVLQVWGTQFCSFLMLIRRMIKSTYQRRRNTVGILVLK